MRRSNAFRSGTSPHLRGNPHPGPAAHVEIRDIPALTGEPIPEPGHGGWHRGHPRTYGGTPGAQLGDAGGVGTSPHLRGNRRRQARDLESLGDIPALTGEPPHRHPCRFNPTGHPRTYGGTRVRDKLAWCDWGTSPHLRGNQHPRIYVSTGERDIPALTGEPPAGGDGDPAITGHPRTYGGT